MDHLTSHGGNDAYDELHTSLEALIFPVKTWLRGITNDSRLIRVSALITSNIAAILTKNLVLDGHSFQGLLETIHTPYNLRKLGLFTITTIFEIAIAEIANLMKRSNLEFEDYKNVTPANTSE